MMISVHSIFGTILVILSIFVLIWNILRATGKVKSNKLRMIFIGLLDFQVLLGIITIALHRVGGLFLLHPIIMLVAVILLHVLTKETRSMRVQLTTYTIATILLIVGVGAANF